ncbi:hypothetical protein LEP1GSC109_2765 [Leptospira interrogans str. UI 13372]|nr:hypothetical protein LEP1GSC088_3149 [Leptospira interrogans str. L1207]EMO94016.1 hypothetical protein LEP1GSC109_2765 [Leptospira interrogans str. UI 13372]
MVVPTFKESICKVQLFSESWAPYAKLMLVEGTFFIESNFEGIETFTAIDRKQY